MSRTTTLKCIPWILSTIISISYASNEDHTIATATYESSINSNINNNCIDESDFNDHNAFISTSILNLDIDNSFNCDTCYQVTCIDSTPLLKNICNPSTPSVNIRIIDNVYPQNIPNSDPDFKLTPSAFQYITNEDISSNTIINITYIPISCDELSFQRNIIDFELNENEYTTMPYNTTAIESGNDEGWASVFGTVIIVIISSVCCCCGFGCIYRRYLEKKEMERNRTDVPDKSRASRTSARHSERSHNSSKNRSTSKKREYSQTLTNTWEKTRKKVAEMVEKSKTMSKPTIKPIKLNNLEANLNEFDDDDMNNNYNTEEEDHHDPEIIEQQLEHFKNTKRHSKHGATNSNGSHSGFTVTPFTGYDPVLYDQPSDNTPDLSLNLQISNNSVEFDFSKSGNTGIVGRHSARNSMQFNEDTKMKVIREERASEIETSSGDRPPLVPVNTDQTHDHLTLAPTNSDNEPTQTQATKTMITVSTEVP